MANHSSCMHTSVMSSLHCMSTGSFALALQELVAGSTSQLQGFHSLSSNRGQQVQEILDKLPVTSAKFVLGS